MSIGLKDKKVIVSNLCSVASKALSLVIADFRGCSVSEMTDLRYLAQQVNVRVYVARNTLAKLAIKGTDYECSHDVFKGPSLLAFSMDDPGAGARIFKDFAKSNESFEIKALAVGGQLLDANQIDVLANLPTRDQALSQLISIIQAPLENFIYILYGIPTKLVRTLSAIRDSKA